MPTRNKLAAQARLTHVREALEDWNISALLVNGEANRRWLTGFTGSAGWLLVTADEAILATDFRYWTQAESQSPDWTLFRLDSENKIANLMATIAPATVGVEARNLTLAAFATLKKIEGIEWKPLDKTLEPWRMVKTDSEVEQIRAAATIADQIMQSIPTLARPGQSERELAWFVEKSLREAGAESIAFPVIVASGPNAALPHHRPGARQLQQGDTVIVDLGATVGGYNSDLTRTFHVGASPTQRFWDIYNLTLSAQTTSLAGMRAGMTGREIDALARDVIAAGGHADHFGHGLGHGVGLAVHEDPRLSWRNDSNAIPANAVATVEPGIYLPGWGGIRLEDLVLFTDEGVELLSHCPKEPLIALHP